MVRVRDHPPHLGPQYGIERALGPLRQVQFEHRGGCTGEVDGDRLGPVRQRLATARGRWRHELPASIVVEHRGRLVALARSAGQRDHRQEHDPHQNNRDQDSHIHRKNSSVKSISFRRVRLALAINTGSAGQGLFSTFAVWVSSSSRLPLRLLSVQRCVRVPRAGRRTAYHCLHRGAVRRGSDWNLSLMESGIEIRQPPPW